MTSTPLKSNSNPLKRSRPILSPFPQNVANNSQNAHTPRHTDSLRTDTSLKSPTRKKRKDPNVENYTPERESNRSRGSSGRSGTPTVKYEAPCEKFTPPRNTVLKMSSAKSTRGRLSTPISWTGTERKVVVKLERSMSPFPPPPIDLTKPPPPPSPTDDPLLLLETPATTKPSEDTVDSIMNDEISDNSTSNPLSFNADLNFKTDIFDSDDSSEDVGEAEGEFTGRFKFYKTPVKDDPPSSTTKQRRESWGRPVSPHPRKIDRLWGDSDEEEDCDPKDVNLNLDFDSSGQVVLPITEQRMLMEEHTTSDNKYILPSVVEISSSDPRAAARAAAILKLHHSYIIDDTGIVSPRSHRSPSVRLNTIDELECHPASSMSISSATERHQTRSPSISYGTLPDIENYQSDEKEWTKACWKILDTCFTDERFAFAEASGKVGIMADVEDIRFDSVVERFIAKCNDSSWDRTMLLRRVRILSNRQRSGRGAPRSTSTQMESNSDNSLGPGLVPPMLLAPRYAHLRNELCMTRNPSRSKRPEAAEDRPPKEAELSNRIPFPAPESIKSIDIVQSPSQSGTKKMLNYLGSFLGRYSPKPSSPPKKIIPSLPEPPEMRQLKGPISTPVKLPAPKEVAPKELVQLNEVIPSMPKPFEKMVPPKEMVNLSHVDPPLSVRPRASSNPLFKSNGSVKDLVKCFEEVGRKTNNEVRVASKPSLRKTASVSNLNTRAAWKL